MSQEIELLELIELNGKIERADTTNKQGSIGLENCGCKCCKVGSMSKV